MWVRDILYDSLFQAVVLSPAAGLIFGIVWAWLCSNLTESSESPQKREERIIIQLREERVLHHYHHLQQRNPEKDQLVRFGGIALSIMAPYFFILYLETITYTLWGSLAFVGALIVGFFVTVFVRWGLNDQWLLELLLALLLLGFCAWLVSLPRGVIDQPVIEAANESALLDFVFNRLTSWGRLLIILQMIGMICVARTAFVILLRGLHTVSLATADPKNPDGLFSRIALSTMRAGGWLGIAQLAIFGMLAWYLLVAAQNADAFIWSVLRRL
jgi:hypothetical protein